MRPERLNRSCPLCGGDALFFREGTLTPEQLSSDKFKITDSDYGLFPDLYRCQSCSLVFSHPMPSRERLISLYSQVVDPEYEQEREGRGQNFLRILKFIERLRPSKGWLLDVGCATGIFLELARDRGWEVKGVEPSSWAVSVARSKKLDVVQGDFEQVELTSSFDVITMIDLIEHVANPLALVEKARKVLKPGGLLVIVTPDIDSFAARVMGRWWWHLRPAHLCFFSRRSLTYLAGRTGFKILRLRRYVWNFSLHYLITRFQLGRRYFNFEIFRKIKLKLPLMDSLEVYLEALP